jgi:hypothetical protein
MMKILDTKNLTGCGEMNSFTFSITVAHEQAGDPPMDEQSVIDYIILRLEAQQVLHVLNIVRDY